METKRCSMRGGLLAALVIGAAGTLLAVSGSVGSQAAGEEQGHPGRTDYIKMGCWQCHGYEGLGADGAGPRIAPKPRAYEAFARAIRKPTGVMPAYSQKVLSEDQLKRIHEYLMSIPPQPDVASVPLLSDR